MISVKQFQAQKLITEMEYPSYSPDLAPNNFWLFHKIKSALKERDFRILKTFKKSDVTGSYSTTGVPKMFLTVAALLG
jgi:hypothetical protein